MKHPLDLYRFTKESGSLKGNDHEVFSFGVIKRLTSLEHWWMVKNSTTNGTSPSTPLLSNPFFQVLLKNFLQAITSLSLITPPITNHRQLRSISRTWVVTSKWSFFHHIPLSWTQLKAVGEQYELQSQTPPIFQPSRICRWRLINSWEDKNSTSMYPTIYVFD